MGYPPRICSGGVSTKNGTLRPEVVVTCGCATLPGVKAINVTVDGPELQRAGLTQESLKKQSNRSYMSQASKAKIRP